MMRRIPAIFLAVFLLGFVNFGFVASSAMASTTEQRLQEINQQWQASVHALNDVNCASCHRDSETKAFVATPTHESCQSCHESSVDSFLLGKHGIRLLEGQSPLTPAMARLPMKHDAFDKKMNCNACHDVHTVNTLQASVDACLTCHNDNHSLNYKNSKHAETVFARSVGRPADDQVGHLGDLVLPRPGAEAVTCATCHLPRTAQKRGDGMLLVKVNHNNTYNLKPQDRMVGDVCMSCHGVEYSYNSIFDDDLVEANFDRPPTLALETFNLMEAAEKRRSGNTSVSKKD